MKCLNFKNLSAKYYNSPILTGLDFCLEQGTFMCLCGPNGAGKSTLLSILANLSPASLKISADKAPSIDDSALSSFSHKKLAQNISYMQQSETCAWDFTVEELVLQGRYCYSNFGVYSKDDFEIVHQILQELDIASFEQRKISSLSGGELQKVRIARALCQQPAFMLLDEPAAGLDFVFEPKLLLQLKELAHKKNIGIIISIHDINTAARFADKMLLLSKGGPALCGTPNQIMSVENLKNAFGVDFSCKEVLYFQSSL